MSKTDLKYPETRTEDCIDCAAGLEFPDPYHWLESESEEVQQWQAAQNELANHYVKSWPYYQALKHSVSQFMVAKPGVMPRYAGGQWFRIGAVGSGSGVIVADKPYGTGRVVYKIERMYLDDQVPPRTLSWLSPSPDGRILAVGICSDGSEQNTFRLIDVDTGDYLANAPLQTLMDGWMGGAQWLPDSSGFYFLALAGKPEDFQQQVLFHCIADGTQQRVELPGQDPKSHEYRVIRISPNGRYHVAYQGLLNTVPIALLDTHQAVPQWQSFITKADCSVVGHIVDHRLIAVTDIDAARGRVVSIPLDGPSCGDPETWTELIPESDAVIRSVTPVGDRLYVSELDDTYSRVRIFSQNGNFINEMPLPGKGGIDEFFFPIMKLASDQYLDGFLFCFSTLTQSWGVYRHSSSADEYEIVQAPQVTLDNTIIEDHWATSADGAQIPYHILRLADTDPAIPQPTLINAYGGFNSARPPVYPGAMAAYVAAGGVYVLGNVRGGSEFGRQWWEDGRMAKMQNCYNDLYAIAEGLIAQNRTCPEQLALNGGSKGGLLAGVAVTQRPELWKAVVPQVPVLDLIGTLRHPYGRYSCNIEYGDPDSSDAINRIVAYSPYHLIKEGVRYPAVLLNAGATDPRCPAWHARKFAAGLQAANKHQSHIFLHVWENAGHGQATERKSLVLQYTEWLAFLMRQLGMSCV